jgi:hypothetical protein
MAAQKAMRHSLVGSTKRNQPILLNLRFYKIVEIAYKGTRGTVRQASAKRTLRKAPPTSMYRKVRHAFTGDGGATMANADLAY